MASGDKAKAGWRFVVAVACCTVTGGRSPTVPMLVVSSDRQPCSSPAAVGAETAFSAVGGDGLPALKELRGVARGVVRGEPTADGARDSATDEATEVTDDDRDLRDTRTSTPRVAAMAAEVGAADAARGPTESSSG